MDQRSSKVGPLNPLRVHKNRESAAPDPIIDTQLADILQYQKQSFSWAIAREESSPNEHEERNQKPRERDWQPPDAVVPTGPEEEEEEEEELQNRAPIPRDKAAGDSFKCDKQSRPGKQN
ncbi:UNVERIFIED_CONTAM: hypothetical protein FKN15_029914 [Acipenser sinensis]